MTYEQMQAIITQMLTIQSDLQQSQIRDRVDIENLIALTASNARSIEAETNASHDLDQKLSTLIQILGEFTEATNTRLTTLKDRS